MGSDKIVLDSGTYEAFGGIVRSENFKSLNTSQLNSGSYLDNNDYLIFNNQTRTLYYDADGNGSNRSAVAITALNVNSLPFNDFILAPTL